jgi:methylthioribose-1-phosphate isomerase
VNQNLPPTIELAAAADGLVVRLIDQTLLPGELRVLDLRTIPEVCEAIRALRVRGAPAIGCTAAAALAMAANRSPATELTALQAELRTHAAALAATRPTAVNLFWALERMGEVIEAANCPASLRANLAQAATALIADDLDRCHRLGKLGADLLPPGARVLTHCNAGGLATAGYGTALGVIRAAHEQGKIAQVWVDETRPLLQGMRLTSWELQQAEIPCTIICDNMAASLMAQGLVDCVVVGADRIAANGDVANKIGTYGVAVLAHYHDVPMYVAAPLSTLDFALATGAGIPIEQRDSAEVTHLGHRSPQPAAPEGVAIHNPAFDVTPAPLVTAIITEAGVARAPYETSLRELMSGQ